EKLPPHRRSHQASLHPPGLRQEPAKPHRHRPADPPGRPNARLDASDRHHEPDLDQSRHPEPHAHPHPRRRHDPLPAHRDHHAPRRQPAGQGAHLSGSLRLHPGLLRLRHLQRPDPPKPLHQTQTLAPLSPPLSWSYLRLPLSLSPLFLIPQGSLLSFPLLLPLSFRHFFCHPAAFPVFISVSLPVFLSSFLFYFH